MNYRTPFLLLIFSLALSACASTGSKSPADTSQQDPVPASVSLAEGDAALRRGELDDAQVKYLVALNAEPESPEILYRIGTIYDSQGKTALAEESFQQALRLDNKHTNSKEALGLLLLKSGRYEDAHKLLKEVVVEDRNRWRSLNGLGVIYDMQKLHEQAQTFYRMALRLNSRSAQLQNNLGYSRYLSGHWEDAELYFRAAVNLQPGYKQAWSNLGLYYVRIGNFDAALEAFEQISEPHQAANNVGYLSMLQDNFETAEKYFEMAIRESPVYYQIAHDNLQRVRNQQK